MRLSDLVVRFRGGTSIPAANLLAQAYASERVLTAARGRTNVHYQTSTEDARITITIDTEFEFIGRDLTATSLIKHEPKRLGEPVKVRKIVRNGVRCLRDRTGTHTDSVPQDFDPRKELDILDMSFLRSVLETATRVRTIGQRSVRGVACDVIEFVLAPEADQYLSQLNARTIPDASLDSTINVTHIRGRLALGTADHQWHQLSLSILGPSRLKADEHHFFAFVQTIWDRNASDIAIPLPDV